MFAANPNKALLYFVVVVLLTCSGCSLSKSPKASDTTIRIVGHLQSSGVDAEYLHAFDSSYMGARGYIVRIDGVSSLWIYEYNSSRSVEQATDRVRENENPAGELKNPHYYSKDNLIICYDGQDKAVLQALAEMFGGELVNTH